MICIIDYGSGNIFSVSNALKKINLKNTVVTEPSQIKNFSTILLPGVGNFNLCAKFKNKNLGAIIDHVLKEKINWICVIYKCYLNCEENGLNKGMALIKGKVTLLNPNQNKLDNEMRLPNMGWSTIKLNNNV